MAEANAQVAMAHLELVPTVQLNRMIGDIHSQMVFTAPGDPYLFDLVESRDRILREIQYRARLYTAGSRRVYSFGASRS